MLEIQENERTNVLSGKSPGTIFFLEHNSVYTSGLRGVAAHFLDSTDIPVHKVKRGGEVTWHGPGQLVIYPVINMKDNGFVSVRDFVRYFGNLIAEVLRKDPAMKDAEWIDEKAGIWIEDRKIAFSGLHFRKFVPVHGYSLNISCNLNPFGKIIPCGIEGLKVTSVEVEKGEKTEVFGIAEEIVRKIKEEFPTVKIIKGAL
jgi:lipoyl(octanoyl) transferase